jgi:hypothetical protein
MAAKRSTARSATAKARAKAKATGKTTAHARSRIRSGAATVQEYLDGLSPEKREVIVAARKLVLKHIPEGYAEFMSWGVINWGIPLSEFADTYNGHPLGYVALGAQKNHNALYLLGCSSHPLFGEGPQKNFLRDAFKKAGKRFDMGQACLRFTSLDDLELDAVGTVIASTTPAQFLANYKKMKGLS